MKFVVLTSNDTRSTLEEDTIYSTLLYTDENGTDPKEAASSKIWERMSADLGVVKNIAQVKINGYIVYQIHDRDMLWDEINDADLDEMRGLTHDDIKAKFGVLTSASIVVEDYDGTYCGLFHDAQELTPNRIVEY